MRVIEPVGRITHYYNKIGVAVIRLDQQLHLGDHVQVDDHRYSFVQTVTSMEQDHERVTTGRKGTEIGVRVEQPVHEGALVFRV